MGFRDELEAARARIEALEREANAAKRVQPAPTDTLAAVCVGLALALAVALAGIGWLWTRPLATANAACLTTADCVAIVERAHVETVPVGTVVSSDAAGRQARWDAAATFQERWRPVVTERIGDAPASIGAVCAARIARVELPGASAGSYACDLEIRCAERPVYPPAGDPALVRCELGADGHVVSLGPPTQAHARARGTPRLLRIDDGPVGTWALTLESAER